MKPNFALDISDTSVGLLHRAVGGWLEIGRAAFDGPDLAEALGFLRDSALGLSPHGITTKLILPSSQVLYCEIEAPGPGKAERHAQIAAGLEGRTPYPVSDLVFDWSGPGPVVQVAVVSKETLDEAEAFGAVHRLNPLSFVGSPPVGVFDGEPWFGPTAMASTLLPAGETVTRDPEPVQSVNREPEEAPTPPASPETEVAQSDRAEADPDAEVERMRAEAEAARAARAKARADEEEADEARRRAQADRAQSEADAVAAAEAARVAEDAAKKRVLADEDGDREEGRAEIRADTDATGSPSFASRRQAEALALADAPVDAPPTDPDLIPPALGVSRPDASPARVEARASVIDAPARTAVPNAPAVAAKPLAPAVRGKSQTTQASSPILRPIPATTPPLGSPGRGVGSKGAAQTVGSAKPVAARGALRPFVRSGAANPAPTLSSDSSMGTFGRKLEQARGRPRYLGLILTVALLLILGLIAAWSSLYLARTDTAQKTDYAGLPVTASEPSASPAVADDPEMDSDLAATGADEGNPDAVPDMGGDPVAAASSPDASGTAPTGALPPTATDAARVTQPVVTQDAATGQTVRANPAGPGQDEIFLTTTDPQTPAFDAASLPPVPVQNDIAPITGFAPPPFGTDYALDAEGRIVPGKTAITTPEGVRLIEARPKPEPPPRPATLAANDPAPARSSSPSLAAPVTGGSLAAPSPADPTALRFSADPGSPKVRPETRPASAEPTAGDGAFALPVADPATGLRPKARPDDRFAEAERSQQASGAAAASLAANLAASDAVARLASASASASTVATIPRRPAARPDDFSGSVQAAVASATRRAPAAEPTPAAPEATAEADSEPEVVASAAPRIPTRANVAKQATFANAINLSETNLIGVYGTSNNRYALVRNASGRFSKVKVGDRIDGGRVAQITGSDLRYQKGSRVYVLSMPKG